MRLNKLYLKKLSKLRRAEHRIFQEPRHLFRRKCARKNESFGKYLRISYDAKSSDK
jgi:hypothetical protein